MSRVNVAEPVTAAPFPPHGMPRPFRRARSPKPPVRHAQRPREPLRRTSRRAHRRPAAPRPARSPARSSCHAPPCSRATEVPGPHRQAPAPLRARPCRLRIPMVTSSLERRPPRGPSRRTTRARDTTGPGARPKSPASPPRSLLIGADPGRRRSVSRARGVRPRSSRARAACSRAGAFASVSARTRTMAVPR